MKNQKPKLIVSYELSEDFDSEFVDFVKWVLEFEEETNKQE